MDTQLSLLLVGCGNMGQAIMGGWLANGVPPTKIRVVDPGPKAKQACATAGVPLVENITQIEDDFVPEAIVLAVKPQHVVDVAPHYQKYGGNVLFVSVIAGTRISWFEGLFGKGAAILRVMPNTPATVQMGITALFANGSVSDKQRAIGQSFFDAVGKTVWLDEEAQIDAVTAVSGSGPAYVFLLIEALEQAAVANGLPQEMAQMLARQTVIGSAQLAKISDQSPQVLRENVTSPGGTTAAALAVLMSDGGMMDTFKEAVAAATNRSRELADATS